jgi:hypothetical protein
METINRIFSVKGRHHMCVIPGGLVAFSEQTFLLIVSVTKSRYSVGLWAGRSGLQGSIPGGGWEFFFHHRVQNGSGAHAASYPMGTRGSFPGGKAAGA